MRLALGQYIKQKLRKSSAYKAVGVAYTADQVLLCAFKKQEGAWLWCLDASFSHQKWQEKLPEFVNTHGLAGAPCFFALSSHWYRIHQIDKPNVAQEDLHSALQWPIKEMIGSDKSIVYDYVELPVQVSGQNKVLAVVVAEDEIKKLTQSIFKAELALKSIVVEEFATTALVPYSDDAVITLVQEHGEVVVLNIIKNHKLYFTRRLKGFEHIGGYSEAELDMGISESICVQIQRSMDFFESQLRQAPIKRILLKLDSPHMSFICEQISQAMGTPCEAFKPDIVCADELNFKMASFSCLGAAYTGVFDSTAAPKDKGKSKQSGESAQGVMV